MVVFTKWGNFITKWVKYLQIKEIKTKQSSTFVTLIYLSGVMTARIYRGHQ